jgi:CheY-like chemotaxis protein
MATEPQTPPAVLLIDDEPGVRDVLAAALNMAGYAVLAAGSGEDGLALCRRLRPAVALVLLDVNLPGLSGPQTLAALKALDPALPCFFLTGGSLTLSAEDLLALGADGVMEKPVRVAELLRVVAGLLPPEPR